MAPTRTPAPGPRDELGLSRTALAVLAARYLRRDADGRVVESTGEMMDRVAVHVAAAEDAYEQGTSDRWAEAFSQMLRARDFLPNSPTLMNAGRGTRPLAGCFVLPIDDSLRSLFTTLRTAALVHQAGAGTGFSFSALRPAGDAVSSGGTASGPVSFIGLYDAAAEIVRQGGRRHAANMAVLDASHPDIEAFVSAKAHPGRLRTFNLSVAVRDGFLHAAVAGQHHDLVNPRTGRVTASVPARDLLASIVEHAWRTGEPGLLFVDRVNAADPLPAQGPIVATNPCGEVPLRAWESCNLGSIDLGRFVRDGGGGEVDLDRLDATVALAVRFLDDVIDVSGHPEPALREAAARTRRVGLGVMGLADLLVQLAVPYDSDAALRLAGDIAARIRRVARETSAALATERGPFPLFGQSSYAAAGFPPLRNAQLTSIAPTGTISLLAGTTSGIEPLFAVAYTRRVLGAPVVEVNPRFERVASDRGFLDDGLLAAIAATGTVRGNPAVPPDVQAVFVTALELAPQWHVRMQATFQAEVDAAVSKTVNLPADATPGDVETAFLDAWRAGCKGITVYRDTSRPGQVLAHVAGEVTG